MSRQTNALDSNVFMYTDDDYYPLPGAEAPDVRGIPAHVHTPPARGDLTTEQVRDAIRRFNITAPAWEQHTVV